MQNQYIYSVAVSVNPHTHLHGGIPQEKHVLATEAGSGTIGVIEWSSAYVFHAGPPVQVSHVGEYRPVTNIRLTSLSLGIPTDHRILVCSQAGRRWRSAPGLGFQEHCI